MKAGRVEAREILIARFTNRAHDLQIVNRFEKVGLAVAVVADDHGALGRELQIDSLEVSEIANRDRVQSNAIVTTHFPLKAGVRFSRKARIPSRMSSVAARRPK